MNLSPCSIFCRFSHFLQFNIFTLCISGMNMQLSLLFVTKPTKNNMGDIRKIFEILIQKGSLFITQSLTNFKLDQTKAHTKNKHCTLVDLNQTCPNLLLFEVPGSGSLKLTESASKSHQQHSAAKPGRIKLSPTLSKLKKRRLVQSCVTPCISNTNQTNTKKIVKSQIVKK